MKRSFFQLLTGAINADDEVFDEDVPVKHYPINKMASLAEVKRHERATGSINLGMHFDRNGRIRFRAARHGAANQGVSVAD